MKLALILGVLAVLATQSAGKITKYTPRLDGRIVGGENTTIEEYPYQISLEYNGRHRCGGSVLSEIVILTAAHCTDGISASRLKVRAGTSVKGSGGVLIQVKTVYVNEKYNDYNTDFDVSLLVLAQPLSFSGQIQPVALPSVKEYLDEPELSVITGWGALHSGGSSPSQLQKVIVPIVSQDKCVKAYASYEVTERMICAGVLGEGGKDACQGDSGGPLVSNGKIHGITSWGLGCAHKNYPGVYTRVTAVRDWIREKSGL
ncbi:trypsin-7-like [Chrysoperla carnea]|uniref:trypsin-7-like n=1 Tax=Chrysoperla carnea TaxID=189513 RepID=UPI001D072FC7|nr:trypsin-7-like [Chrysoperla carnea]